METARAPLGAEPILCSEERWKDDGSPNVHIKHVRMRAMEKITFYNVTD